MRYIGKILSISVHRKLGTVQYNLQDGSETFAHTTKFFFKDCINFEPEVGMEVSFELAPFRALHVKELKGHGNVILLNFERNGGKC